MKLIKKCTSKCIAAKQIRELAHRILETEYLQADIVSMIDTTNK